MSNNGTIFGWQGIIESLITRGLVLISNLIDGLAVLINPYWLNWRSGFLLGITVIAHTSLSTKAKQQARL